MKSYKTYLLTFALFLVGNAMAQIEDTAIFKAQVITGEIMPTDASKSVQNVRIITAKNIERQGAVNLKDVLSKELNVRVSNDNILGSSMSLQGISGQNVKILLDGVPLIGRENGNIDLNQLNLSNIERIEIIEGPLSVIYGTDALGGVINLISKKILLNKPSLFTANGYYETIGQYNIGGGGILKLNNMDFSANISRNFFSGYSTDKSSREMSWKPKQQVFGNFSILNEVGKLRLRFKTDIFNEKIENKGPAVINHLEGYAFDEYYITNRIVNSLSLDYRKNTNNYWNLLSSFSFYQRDKVTYRMDLVTVKPELVQNRDANSSTSFLNFMTRGSYNVAYSKKFNYQLGFDINLNSGFGTKIQSDKGKMNDYAMFACAEFKQLKNFIIKPGFRATYNSKYPAPFIPSIQIQFRDSARKNFTARYSYGKGFRAPSLKELYLNFVDYNHNIQGNPNLRSEVSNNHNFAMKYKLKINKGLFLYLENNNYYNHIYHQIAIVSVDPSTFTYTYHNIDNFKSIGSNFNIATQFNNWNISTGAAMTGIYNNAFQTVNKSKYNYMPELRTQITYAYITKKKQTKTNLSLYYKYNGKSVGYALNETRDVVQTYIQDYQILDLTANRSFYNKRLNVTLGCKNLFNIKTLSTSGTSTSFHSGGTTSTPFSVGRSLFCQFNLTI